MRSGERSSVFDRTNWERKTRAPSWYRRAELEKHPAPEVERKATEVS